MRPVLAAVVLAAASAPSFAQQTLPPCEELDRLWRSTYYEALHPDWALHPLACGKEPGQMSMLETRDVASAAAGYFLHRTEWTGRPHLQPLVSGGGISAPPNMLRWVAARSRGIVADAQTVDAKGRKVDVAYFDGATGKIHLSPRNFTFGKAAAWPYDRALEYRGAGLAAQLIHESRHSGYGHVACPGGNTDCDPTIAEDFDGGGSHAIAAIWMAWILRNSQWGEGAKTAAREGIEFVVLNRINDRAAADDFACRYLGKRVIDPKKRCAAFR